MNLHSSRRGVDRRCTTRRAPLEVRHWSSRVTARMLGNHINWVDRLADRSSIRGAYRRVLRLLAGRESAPRPGVVATSKVLPPATGCRTASGSGWTGTPVVDSIDEASLQGRVSRTVSSRRRFLHGYKTRISLGELLSPTNLTHGVGEGGLHC